MGKAAECYARDCDSLLVRINQRGEQRLHRVRTAQTPQRLGGGAAELGLLTAMPHDQFNDGRDCRAISDLA
jgi:hypothetical protein